MWLFVEARQNGGLFETQYSSTYPQKGRALAAKVVGVGDSAPKNKKSGNRVGYAEVSKAAEAAGNPSIEPLPENRNKLDENQKLERLQAEIPEPRNLV